jgi:hypothetical protein
MPHKHVTYTPKITPEQIPIEETRHVSIWSGEKKLSTSFADQIRGKAEMGSLGAYILLYQFGCTFGWWRYGDL